MEITGRIIAVLDKRTGVSNATGTAWSVQQYVIETHEQYPKKICFDVFGEDRIKQFAIQIGEEVTVSFDLDAREYQGRWYNSIRAWKVERVKPETSNNLNNTTNEVVFDMPFDGPSAEEDLLF
ncbi:MAG: DUF3127 domain-containing protein [Bacteroidaceae bacterium]|nr:DUF3127 domain-containing protein [Bacteroidaceae bacterium]